jgi:molybdopterin molybdotransferase
MSGLPVASLILSFEEARRVVEEQAARIPAPLVESADLISAAGRVLAESVLADRDFPPFPRSTRDGYAVRSADLSQIPARLKLVGEIRAGENLENVPKISAGQAVEIMTGAPVPESADAVVMIENTVRYGEQIEIARSAGMGENIVPRGAEAKQGSVLLERGRRINDATVALAASAGKSRLRVFKRPRVAVLATGDELVDVTAPPGPTQIRNSNSYSLAAQILSAGGDPVLLPVAPDEPQTLRRLIEDGLKSDLLLLTGGVSVGRYDFVERVLAEMRAHFFFTGAKIQPGRPVVFGQCGLGKGEESRYFFGLPGNPVSTMVTFELFARPVVEALSGQNPHKLLFVHARLRSEIRVKPGLRRFLPAILSGEFENSGVELIPWQGSGDIGATARANCYVVVPADRDRIAMDEWVAVMMR